MSDEPVAPDDMATGVTMTTDTATGDRAAGRLLYPDLAPPLVYPGRTPRPGDLTGGWRIITALAWIGVILAMATVWNVSRQLGLSTWWLGTRAQPQLRIVQFSPFVCPALMLLGAVNHVRWLGWFGLIAAGALVGYAVVDLGQVSSIAAVELLIGGLAAAVSIASLTGTYRRDPSAGIAQNT